MVDKAEVDNGTREIEALKEEISKQTAEQIKAEFIRMSLRAGELKTQIDNKLALEGKAPDKLEGDASDKDSAKGKAVDVKKEIKKILLTGKTTDKSPTPQGKSKEVTELAKTIIKKISVELDPEKMDITENSSPYLYSLLSKVIEGKIVNIDGLQEEFKNLSYLAGVNRNVYDKVRDALIEVVKERGFTDEQAKEKFKTEEKRAEPEKKGEEKKTTSDEEELIDENGESYRRLEENTFLQDWQTYYIHYFDKEDYSLVKSFYSPQEFISYVANLKSGVERDFKSQSKTLDANQIGKEVSERLIAQITALYGKLYTKLDLDNPKEFFEQIEDADFFKGIKVTENNLRRGINGLERYMERHESEVSEKLGKMKFWKNSEGEQRVEEIKKERSKKKDDFTNKIRFRLAPLVEETDVNSKGFIEYIRLVTDQYRETRRYTHNARAIFFHPPDHEKGFYAQLGEYAENLKMVDLEEMLLLPDHDIFLEAFCLYDKIIEEQFAFQDWRHTATMFTPEIGSKLTTLEIKVLEDLKLIYGEKLNKGEMTEGRLRAALSMAVGASRGIFLNEVEKAAFADPHLTEDGRPTFVGYHTFDAAPLTAFNPMHFFNRWQGERTLNPILFLPIDGLKSIRTMNKWDHHELWEKMKLYRGSFLTGRKDLGDNTLFADFLNNISRAGGPLKRKGWRTEYQLNNLFIFKKEDGTTLNNLKTWQVLENIGYEALSDLVDGNKFSSGFLNSREKVVERQELFQYLFDKHFEGQSDLNTYLSGIRKAAREKVYDEINSGKRFISRDKKNTSEEDIEKEVEFETSQIFLYRTLSRIVMQRIPTKVLRIERDRDTQDGDRRWKKIQRGEFDIDGNKVNFGAKEFDAAMKDGLLAETLLRKEVSQSMRNLLKEQATEKRETDMSELGDKNKIIYKLSEEKIKRLLENIGLNKSPDGDGRIKRAIAVYRQINNEYGFGQQNQENLDKFANFLQKKSYKYTFAIDELDISFIPFRGGGNRVLARAVKDISALENGLIKGVMNFPVTLHEVAISGKGDFGPILEILEKARKALSDVHGDAVAYEVVENMAAVAIAYFKKDTIAKPLFGIMGMGRKNSMAAEWAGRSTAVWEWDSRDIDNFLVALETHRILPRQPYDIAKTGSGHIDKVRQYIKLPWSKEPFALPAIFDKRKPDYPWYAMKLRNEFGAGWNHIAWESIYALSPYLIAFLIWKFMSDALKEAEGKKK